MLDKATMLTAISALDIDAIDEYYLRTLRWFLLTIHL